MTWRMKFDQKVVDYFYEGKDNQRRACLCHILIKKYTQPNFKCLQVGVSHFKNEKFGTNWVSLDKYDKRPCIDYRCDLEKTPFDDNTFDFIICNAVLEHVTNPFNCVKEMVRVLKNKGEIWVEAPFVQYYHPRKDYDDIIHGIIDKRETDYKDDDNHGGDYWRFTAQGLVELMKPLECIEILLINEGGLAFYGRKL